MFNALDEEYGKNSLSVLLKNSLFFLALKAYEGALHHVGRPHRP